MKDKPRYLILKYKEVGLVFLLLSIIYVLQSFLTKPNASTLQKYHLGSGQFKWLILTIVVPLVVIWIISLLGYLRLREYTEKIDDDRDGKAFKLINKGILFFGLWLPLSSVLNNYFSSIYTAHPADTAALVILSNYISVVFLIPAFWFIYHGTNKLMALTKPKATFVAGQKLTYVYIVFSALYIWLVLSDTARRVPNHGATVASYYQPDWLIIITIALPRLLMWFIGFQAVQNLYSYTYRVKGTIYRRAVKELSFGLGAVVSLTIMLRVLESLSVELGKLSLDILLLIIYVLLILIAGGYILVARGAAKLQRLEDI